MRGCLFFIGIVLILMMSCTGEPQQNSGPDACQLMNTRIERLSYAHDHDYTHSSGTLYLDSIVTLTDSLPTDCDQRYFIQLMNVRISALTQTKRYDLAVESLEAMSDTMFQPRYLREYMLLLNKYHMYDEDGDTLQRKVAVDELMTLLDSIIATHQGEEYSDALQLAFAAKFEVLDAAVVQAELDSLLAAGVIDSTILRDLQQIKK